MNKKTFKPNNKKAFSLIELSIVLIIIGLLIAGV
ncbi:MAG: prepilin-type N-terminal cleavage/methylation domain-containing protein, partial [Rickettsiales bacterium]